MSEEVDGYHWDLKLNFRLRFFFLTYIPLQCLSIGLKFGLVHKSSTCESSSLVINKASSLAINKAKTGFKTHLNVHNRDM